MLKIYQNMTTPVGSNEQTGVGQATVTLASGFFKSRGIFGGADSCLFILNVTAVSGTATPTLTVKVQGYDPASTLWVDVATFPAQTAVSTAPITLAINPVYFVRHRVFYTVTGTTPSFTFSCGAWLSNDEGPIS